MKSRKLGKAADALLNLMDWAKTPQGIIYWASVYTNIDWGLDKDKQYWDEVLNNLQPYLKGNGKCKKN